MFDKLKKLNELKKIQSELGQEKMEVEKNGIKVTINGKMEIELNANIGHYMVIKI